MAVIPVVPQLWGVLNLVIAGALSTLVGLERQYHHKPAGARTLALVGLGAAAFMVVSKYGFVDQGAGVDGSRIAAQVASGVGFLGAGLIFVRRGAVRGLTSAASIWVVAAVGLMSGAGQWIAAAAVVGLYHLVNVVLPRLSRVLPQSESDRYTVTVSYRDGAGALRDIIGAVVADGLRVLDFTVHEAGPAAAVLESAPEEETVQVVLGVAGARDLVDRVRHELLDSRDILAFEVAPAH